MSTTYETVPTDASVEINGLFARYCRGLDHKEQQEFMSIWWEDAVLVSPLMPDDCVGHEGIRAFYDMAAQHPAGQHWTTNLILRSSGPTEYDFWAHYLYLVGANTDGKAKLQAYGEYRGVVSQREGRWGFARFEIHRLAAQ